jgi:hypothetical protein
VHDVTAVKRHLDDITHMVETLLKGRPFWVLIEEQYTQFLADSEAKRCALVFTLQLESCISMYFVQKGVQVRTIHATKPFPFLGYAGWKQDTRWDRKQRVAAEVSKLLDPSLPGNEFAHREHDLTNWSDLPMTQRHDIADAISQALSYYYRNVQDFMDCNPSPPVSATDNTPSTSSVHQATAPNAPRRRHKQSKTTKAEVRGKLERTLAQIGISYYGLLRGEQRQSARLYKVFQHDPQNPYLLDFLKPLMSLTNKGLLSQMSHRWKRA